MERSGNPAPIELSSRLIGAGHIIHFAQINHYSFVLSFESIMNHSSSIVFGLVSLVCCLQSVIFCLESCVCCLWSANGPSTSVENPLQINLFMQSKPNFRKSQMNLKFCKQTAYENKRNWTLGQSKPNSKPIQTQLPKG